MNTKETIGLGARREEKERKSSNVDERHSGSNAAKAFGIRRSMNRMELTEEDAQDRNVWKNKITVKKLF